MFIKEASEVSGATQRAIRLYESLGLLKVPRSGRYRVYNESNINLIKIIKEAQSIGIKLSELVALKCEEEDFQWQRVSEFLSKRHTDVEAQIKALKVQKQRIEEYKKSIDACLQGVDSDL
ncbi:HTH-type transcriptional regulator HmrR [Marinomonas spartinae]|uniref:HTH-type transcriptional regulator HmrR n=1 Tax=Marinomonas spartinae TaxID=1792290 RepID=A0A1A8TSM5_9GAMM|nr:MerR family transcriptional regulator [Marinomonas spartinae]SBS37755.1 HTH-type transcriptional regulator HmrR [Marinomonas spartinae]